MSRSLTPGTRTIAAVLLVCGMTLATGGAEAQTAEQFEQLQQIIQQQQ